MLRAGSGLMWVVRALDAWWRRNGKREKEIGSLVEPKGFIAGIYG